MKTHAVFLLPGIVVPLPDLDLPEIETHEELDRLIYNEGWNPAYEVMQSLGLNYPPEALRPKLTSKPDPRDTFSKPWVIVVLKPSPGSPFFHPLPPLTDHQLAVFKLFAKLKSDQEIADELQRSLRWVKYRIAELKKIFNVHTRAGLYICYSDHDMYIPKKE